MAEGTQRVDIVVEGRQAQADPARDLGAAIVREAGQLGVVEDRHDAGHDRHGDAGPLRAFDEIEVGAGVVEILGDGGIGASLHLLGKMAQVVVGRAGLRVDFGVSGHFDGEPVAAVFADEAHQIGGVPEVAQSDHAGGQVATQGHQPADALGTVAVEQFADAVAGGADAGQVGGHVRTGCGDVADGFGGAGLGAAAGPEGDAEVVGLEGLQGLMGVEQFLGTGVGGRGEELEAQADGHGCGGGAHGSQKRLRVVEQVGDPARRGACRGVPDGGGRWPACAGRRAVSGLPRRGRGAGGMVMGRCRLCRRGGRYRGRRDQRAVLAAGYHRRGGRSENTPGCRRRQPGRRAASAAPASRRLRPVG